MGRRTGWGGWTGWIRVVGSGWTGWEVSPKRGGRDGGAKSASVRNIAMGELLEVEWILSPHPGWVAFNVRTHAMTPWANVFRSSGPWALFDSDSDTDSDAGGTARRLAPPERKKERNGSMEVSPHRGVLKLESSNLALPLAFLSLANRVVRGHLSVSPMRRLVASSGEERSTRED